MPALTISGIDLNFPFEPYPCQVNYMKCVLDSIIEVSFQLKRIETHPKLCYLLEKECDP